MSVELGFVVLHYKTVKDTQNCVESILNTVDDAPIVVVDNGSGDKTGIELKERYSDNNLVTVLCLEENLGFAKGNNEGIKCIREKYNPTFVAVMNNDTLIKHKEFSKIIMEEYARSNFAVMGPQIITPDNDNKSNPVEYLVDNQKKVCKLLLKRRIKLLLNRLHLNFMINDVGKSVKSAGIYDNSKRYENVKLHGACWIFSPAFFREFEGINDSTFLYFEEDILYLDLSRKKLKNVYNPKLVVWHLEDSSTNSVTKTTRGKNIFVLKNEIKSLKVLYKILSELK